MLEVHSQLKFNNQGRHKFKCVNECIVVFRLIFIQQNPFRCAFYENAFTGMFYLHWNLGWQKRFLVFDKDVLSSRFINILSVHQIDFYFHGTRARTLAFFDTYSALCMTPLPHLQSCRLQRPRFPRSVSIGWWTGGRRVSRRGTSDWFSISCFSRGKQ